MKWLLIFPVVLMLAGCEVAGSVEQEPPAPPGVKISGTVEVGVIGTL